MNSALYQNFQKDILFLKFYACENTNVNTVSCGVWNQNQLSLETFYLSKTLKVFNQLNLKKNLIVF